MSTDFRLGRNIVRTFFEYFRVTGTIPMSTTGATPSGAGQNQESEKKRAVRRKSRSRSRSRPKSKENGERVASPTQKTAISNEGRGETWSTSHSSMSKENTPERTIVKLHQLTTENHDSDSSDESSSDEDGNQKAVKFFGTKAVSKRQPLKPAPRGRQSVRTVSAKGAGKGMNDSSPSPPTSPTPTRSKFPQAHGPPPKAAFTTFDFSVLHENYYSPGKVYDPYYHRRQREKIRSRAARSTAGRKVGGGGIVGVSVKPGKDNRTPSRSATQGNNSDTDGDAPCLTIIDFNLLLRKGLDAKSRLGERGWKGWSAGKAMNYKASNELSYSARQGRREVRRRRAILLRGTITDCSPWEDTSSDSDSSIAPISKKINSYFVKNHRSSQAKGKRPGFPSSFSS